MRRTSVQLDSNSALAEVRDGVVHSLGAATGIPGPYTRHVCADTITIPTLVNTVSLEASDELVLLVTEAPADVGAHMGAKHQQK